MFVGFSLTLIPFSIVCGILAVFGARTVRVNGAPVTGVGGLFASMFLGPILALAFSIVCWLLLLIGLWIYSQFRTFVIRYTPKGEN
jgi:hypothetical protein